MRNNVNETQKIGKYTKVDNDDKVSTNTVNATDFSSVIKILLRASGSVDEWKRTEELDFCFGKYSDTILVSYFDDETEYYLFYYGNPTQDMPWQGVANYIGDSIYGSIDDEGDDLHMGNATFTANFADKTLTGKLKKKVSTIDVKANISGNQFTGTAQSSIDTAVADVNGGFYGVNAKELAGLALAKDGKGQWGVGFIAGKK